MKSAITISLGLVCLAATMPAPNVERVLPPNWQYKITSLRGPGCPDFGEDPEVAYYTTRLTYGQNTMDGSEIYYWFVAYPHLRVDLNNNEHSWCETELSYEEFGDSDRKSKTEDYRLRLHKNGTRVIATYDLEKGVMATFKFEYDEGNDEGSDNAVTDLVKWSGPISSGQYQKEDSSPVSPDNEMYKLPKCGAGKIKFRTELKIEGKPGQKGYVQSEHQKDAAGIEQYYGIQQGFSYDWEKCKK